MQTKVDFSFSFAPPHRMTICRPGDAEKTLLDLEPGKLTLIWSYEKLSDFIPNIWKAPHFDWKIEITPMIDGQLFDSSRWTRAEGGIPSLVNIYESSDARCLIEAIGAVSAALFRVTFENKGKVDQDFCLNCEHIGGWVISNPAWIDGNNANLLTAMEYERPDRILVFGVGADEYPILNDIADNEKRSVPLKKSVSGKKSINGQKTMISKYHLKPGESKTGWVIRPYEAYERELPQLLNHDWMKEFQDAQDEWQQLLSKTVRFDIPDEGVQTAFHACLADIFVMREPVKDGYVSGTPGTEVYRSPSSGEPVLGDILLDQVGLHAEAEEEIKIHLDAQDDDGNWNDPKGWGHHMWCISGFKSWAVMEHYHLTGDKGFLAQIYPRMLSSSRWQEKQRMSTRVLNNGNKGPTFGLMPRGMGDCGLINGNDYFGIFYPHNFFAVFADRLTLEAAEILERHEDLPEIKQIYETGIRDLRLSLDKGAIAEDDFRWIPGTPEKDCGSRWGALAALYPCKILDGENTLISGTFRKIESSMGPCGLPAGLGWMNDGYWVGLTLDNIAQAYLACGNGDVASRYLYPVLNSGTPLVTWCEERGMEAGSTKVSGDRQHLWTPLAICRYIRDSMVMEREDGLELASGTPIEWLSSGDPLGIADAPTHFGTVSFNIKYDKEKNKINGYVSFPYNPHLKWAVLHIRLDVNNDSLIKYNKNIRWENPKGRHNLNIDL